MCSTTIPMYDYGSTLLVHYFFYWIEWYNAMIMITEAPLMLSFCYVTSKENGTSELEHVSVDIAIFIVFTFVFYICFQYCRYKLEKYSFPGC